MAPFTILTPLIVLLVDDDSEPILGQWFEETLSPDDPPETPAPPPAPVLNMASSTGTGKHSQRQSSTDCPNFVPDKREPDGVSK